MRANERFELHAVDLASADIGLLLDGCDVVFHLAAEPGVRSSWGRRFDRFVHNNVEATQRLLEAVRERPGLRLVYASSSSVYGESEQLPTREDAPPRPLSPYGVTKLAGEQLCRVYHVNHGVDTVALRFFTVYGPRQRPDMAFRRFCEAAARGGRIELFGDGRQSRDFTYVARRRERDPRRRGGGGRRRPRLQHRRRLAGQRQRRARGARLDRGPPARRAALRPRVRRRPAHRGRRRPCPRGARLRARHARSQRGCARSTSGCVERAEQGRGLAAVRGA